MNLFRLAHAILAAGALLPCAALGAEPAHAKEADPDPKVAKVAKGAKAGKAAPDAHADDSHGKVASAAPAAATDPLERLRQRLADKLTVGKAGDAAGPNDLHVATKAPPAARAAAPARAGAYGAATHGAAGAQKAGATRGAEAGHAHWAYNGAAGPQTWGGLKPEFSLCGSGQRQSPIDIRDGLAVDLEPVRFDYQASRFGVIDNGHTVQVNVAQGNAIEVGGKRFELLQFHFHRPSEERIDGRQFEMSVHLVHKDDQGRLAVVTVLLDKGSAQPALQRVWNNLPLEKNEELAARTALDINELLPADRRYYTYMGSLTTPPCSEGVQWVVMRQPVTVAPEQIELFARIYPMNARPLQQASGRRIMQSN
jgi:carbonic anhydrase